MRRFRSTGSAVSTPYRNSPGANKPFKSPMITSSSTLVSTPSAAGGTENSSCKNFPLRKSTLPVTTEEFRAKEKTLDEQIEKQESEGHSVDELKVYIEQLHTYNEMKDVAQTLLGRIALREELTLKETAIKFEAPDD